MYLEVSVQLVLSTKALQTYLTGEWSLSSMNSHVSRQILGIFRHKETSDKGALVEFPVCRLLLCCLLGASSLRLLLFMSVEMNHFLLVIQAWRSCNAMGLGLNGDSPIKPGLDM